VSAFERCLVSRWRLGLHPTALKRRAGDPALRTDKPASGACPDADRFGSGVDNSLLELRRRRVELRVLPNHPALRDGVVASTLQFSIIRMRNVLPGVSDRGSGCKRISSGGCLTASPWMIRRDVGESR
jgi:hypothetical protein